MDFDHLATSTPMRRSTRLRAQKPTDELNSSTLKDISMVSNGSSPLREQNNQTDMITPVKTPTQCRSFKDNISAPRLKRNRFRIPLSSHRIDAERKNNGRKRKLQLQDCSMAGNDENVQIEETPKRSRTLEFSDYIEKDMESNEIYSTQIGSNKQLLFDDADDDEDDGLELSFKTPPVRTYSFTVQRKKSEIDQLIRNDSTKFGDQSNGNKKNKKRSSKKTLTSWDNAIKRNKKLQDFVNTFNQELEQIESIPLSVVTEKGSI